MSELKTNKIQTNDTNNVSIDDALKFKSYTTTQRDALTSVAGDMIYNTTTSKVEFYNGSAWVQGGGPNAFNIEYVIIAGGGAGGASYAAANGGNGGGAGGYVSNVAGENTGGSVTADNRELFIEKGVAYPISVGAGATGQLTTYMGSPSYFGSILAVGGGSGFDMNTFRRMPKDGGSGAGGQYTNSDNSNTTRAEGSGTPTQGHDGGRGGYDGQGINYGPSGGGGGAGSAGGAAGTAGGQNNNGGAGGAGVSSSITGSSVTRAGGGGGGVRSDTGTRQPGAGGSGGGGAGGVNTGGNGVSGTVNTGGGGGGNSGDDASYVGGSGGSGIVILRYLTADVSSYSQSGLTITASTTGSYSVLQITAGTGTITFS